MRKTLEISYLFALDAAILSEEILLICAQRIQAMNDLFAAVA
jgi:hypothetical protein